MGDFQEDNFEQKLLAVKDTQESIQSLSLWCLKHSQQHKKIVSCWLHVLKKVKVEQRLTLFYLANDVIQYSKRKNYPFVDSWATALQKATPLVREEKVRHKILRLFKIWNERNIYDETFLADLSGLLTALTKKTSNQQTAAELIQEFQPSSLFLKIRKCKALEEDTDLKLKIVKECSIPVSDPDALQVVVKDRRNGDDLMQDVEDGIVKLEAYTEALESEIKERVDVINVLEVSEQFYDTQRGEAKVVCNAYRNFGNRIKTLKRKLEELLPSLPSPVPSPDIDAPSPSSESDIDIPEETKAVCYDSEKSFIGTDFVTAMNHVSENQNQLRRSVSQNYGHSDMNSSVYNPNMTNNYDEYAHQRHMNAAPIGYYKNNSHLELESPASPIERNITHDSFLHFTEGNPIEVISSTNNDNHSNFNASGFLQNIMAANASAMSTPAPIPPVPGKIPGLESPTDNARDVFCFMEAKAKTADESGPIMWGDKPLTKYQSWPSPDITWTNSQETPVSPPAFEKESFSTPVEYVDTNHPVMDSRGQFLFNSEQPPPPQPQHQHEEHQQKQRLLDMDHRLINHLAPSERSDQISTIPLPKLDTDDRIQPMCSVPNRNLISLTDSPSSSGNESWKASNDADYRGDIPVPPPTPTKINNLKMPQDNIESVDMELSDDESESKGEERNNINSNAATRHRKSSFREEESSSSSTLSKIPTNIDGDKDRGIDEDAQLLLPPPNPWDMMNVPHLDSGAINESLTNVSKMAEVDFNKMMSNFVNQPPSLEPPIAGGGRPPPLPDFTQFPLPPLPTGQPPPPPPFGSDIRFPQPPVMSIPPPPPPSTADSSAFHTRPDYGRLPPANHLQRPPNFRPLPPQPFGFMPSPMFMNNGSMGQSMATSTPTKEFPPVHQQQKMYGRHSESPGSASSDTNEQRYGNNIEPLIKTRQFDRQTPDSGVSGAGSGMGSRFDMGHEISSNKSMRSNLKEISLSDVLERSILRSKDEEEIIPNSQSQVDAASGACAIDHDLFSSVDDAMDENNGGSGSAVKDDGADDLYNNIDETHADASGQNSVTTNSTAAVPQITSTEALAAAVVAAVSNSMAVAAAAAAAFSAGNKTPVPKTLPSDFKFAQNNNFGLYDSVEAVEPNSGSGETSEFQSPVKPKTPFQAIVPKVAKPLVAPPPNFMEDDERSPWPLMPVIDLSGEANDISTDEGGDGGDSVTGGGGYNQQYQHPNNSYNMDRANGSPAAFLRPHMKNDFRPRFFGSGGGDRRFSSPGQSPMRGTGGDVRGRGRFSSQRGDFRPRGGGGGYQMSPNQIRMPRTPSPFQRSPGGVNFQNSPRMFKGSRPNRPFRRNW